MNSFSLLVPVYNGARILPQFFAAVRSQSVQPVEILVSDSESTDGSAEICHEHGARVFSVCRESFDHGGTRTMLAQEAQSEILVYLTQDALLADSDALEKLLVALEQSGDIACAYGRQLPREEATVQAAFLRFFNYPPQSEIRSYADQERLGLKTAFISNSFAAYKRDALASVGYFRNGLIFGEDTCTLGRILLAGRRVAYCAEASVYHSHNYGFVEEFRRSFDIGVLHVSESWLLETFGGATEIGGNFVRLSLKNIINQGSYLLVFDWFLRCAMKFLGYKLGRLHQSLPVVLRPCLSMNRSWWKGQ